MEAPLLDTDTIAPKASRKRAARRERQRIWVMETPPREDWFQRVRDELGRDVWFLRLQLTGLRPRRYGPFASKHKGLLFLDHLLDGVTQAICEADNDLAQYWVPSRPYGLRRGHYPVVEDELCTSPSQAHPQDRAGAHNQGR